MPLRKFTQAVQELVRTTETDPLPDYDLSLEQRKNGLMLRMQRRAAEVIAGRPNAQLGS